ncbi:MAG TPA: hypothetical protein VD793_03045, partial [Gemmatimonadales bacterium]|nr:hypothetical protein [Gemmatimonadales bacterium]
RAVAFNWTWYWRGLPGHFAYPPGSGTALISVAGLALGTGMVRTLGQHRVLVLSIAGTVGLLSLWPWPHDRFVAAYLPFAGLAAGAGAQWALRACRRPIRLAAQAALVGAVINVGVRQAEIHGTSYWPSNPQDAIQVASPGYVLISNTRFLVSVANWARANTQPHDRVMVFSPAAFFLLTGRLAVSADPAESAIRPSVFQTPGRYLAERILEDGVSVVVEGSGRIRAELTALERRCPGSTAYAGRSGGWAAVPVFRVGGGPNCLRAMLPEP